MKTTKNYSNEGFDFKSNIITPQVEDEALVRKNHQQIIKSATELFAKEGYYATTIRQIVKHSGIGIGSIYQYVKNKEEILVLILEYILNQYEYMLSKAIDVQASPEQKIKTCLDCYYRIIDHEAEKITLAYASTISLSEKYRVYIKELELKTNEIFEKILNEGVEQDAFQSINVPLIAYDMIMLGHMWALKRWYFKTFMTIDEFVEQQTAHFLTILLKK